MAGEIRTTVVGNLTADPELRSTQNGAQVVNFTIASTPRAFDRQSNQFKDGSPFFLRCSAWRDLAQHIAQSLGKGARVIACGALRQRSYEASDGTNRTVVEMEVEAIGPDLRYATAQVVKQARADGGNGKGEQKAFGSYDPDTDPWTAPTEF